MGQHYQLGCEGGISKVFENKMELVKVNQEVAIAGHLVQDFSQHLALLCGAPQETNLEE